MAPPFLEPDLPRYSISASPFAPCFLSILEINPYRSQSFFNEASLHTSESSHRRLEGNVCRRCLGLPNFTCTSRHVFLILAVPVSFHAVLPLIAWLGFRTIHHLPQILDHENHLHRVLPGPVVGAPFQRDDTPNFGILFD